MAGVEFTNGDQPGVRLTKIAAAHSVEPASAFKANGRRESSPRQDRPKRPRRSDRTRALWRQTTFEAALAVLRRAFELAGVEFIDKDGGCALEYGCESGRKGKTKVRTPRCRTRPASGRADHRLFWQNEPKILAIFQSLDNSEIRNIRRAA